MAKGLCARCYSYQYAHDPQKAEKVREQKREWYFRQGGFMWAKKEREKRWFAGKREKILARDKYRCQKCRRKYPASYLVVHHKDGKGRGHQYPNNDEANLITLCKACHLNVHRDTVCKYHERKKLDRWARKYHCCVGCGTTERKHRAFGLCWKCYWKKRKGNLKI
ncbi:MAG: HNH endonuclease signature motif containing protein [Candidatus Hadarchaeum sp.]